MTPRELGPLIRGAAVFVASGSVLLAWVVDNPITSIAIGPVCLIAALVASNYLPERAA